MYLSKSIVFVIFFFWSIHTLAQRIPEFDSLKSVYDTAVLSWEDKFRVGRKIAHNHPDVAEGLRISQEILSIARSNGDSLRVAIAFEEISHNERLLGNNKSSLASAYKALEIFEWLNEDIRTAASYVQIGTNQLIDQDYKSAVNHFRAALDIYGQSDKKTNYGLTQINLGEAYRLNNQTDSAIYHFESVLLLNNSLKKPIIEGYARGNLGMALRSKGELTEAKTELIIANEILTELGDSYSVSVYTADLAQISMAEGKQALAEEQLLKAYSMARDEGLKEQIRDFSAMLVAFYEDRNDFAQALDYQKVYQVYQDSLVNKENVQEIERLKANYEIDKREGQIDLLEQLTDSQRTFNLALGGGLLIFGMLAAMLYQSNKQKREANAMLGKQQVIVTRREEEKAVLLKELNHRVKNNLQMVSSLLSLQENQLAGHPAAEAINAGKLRVEALSLIHQKLYQDDVHTSIQIKAHLDQLVSNLLYSYGDPFKAQILVRPVNLKMDIDTAIPLSLIVNELVTNALKYAYKGIESPILEIDLSKPNDYYDLEISDNGIGIDHEKDGSNSFGLRLVRSLVHQLNGSLQVQDNAGGGTRWVIRLRAHSD